MNQAKKTYTNCRAVTDEHVQGVTPTNTDNLSAHGRRQASIPKELTVLMTRYQGKAMLRRERERPPCQRSA